MRISCSVLLSYLVYLSQVQLAAEEGYPNRLPNPGFEQTRGEKIVSWTGPIDPVADEKLVHSGKCCVRVTVRASKGAALVRSRARGVYYTANARHRFSIWAKGKGQLRLGYDTYPPQAKGSPYRPHMWQRQWTTLSDRWREIKYDFNVLDPRSARRINVCAELRGKGAEAYLDDASLMLAPPSPIGLDVFPIHGMVPRGGQLDIEVRVLRQGRPITSGDLRVITQAPDGKVTSSDVRIDPSGLTRYPFKSPLDASIDPREGLFYRFLIVHLPSGEARFCSIEIVEKPTYDALKTAAEQVKLAHLPAHVLFIGDSLSDGRRGFNYTDKVGFWLRKVNGPKVTYKNVGVGGDFITRVWMRLNRDPKVYRLHAYERIFDPRPTLVFIFLGHNDSKVHSKRGTTCVPRERFQKEFTLTIRKIQADTHARVIVMSSSSSAYEVIRKRWPEWEKKRPRGFSKFGIPQVMEEFNAIMRKTADETGAEYLDVYGPTKNYPDKPSLFTADGVHVNNKGNQFLALQILKYLSLPRLRARALALQGPHNAPSTLTIRLLRTQEGAESPVATGRLEEALRCPPTLSRREGAFAL